MYSTNSFTRESRNAKRTKKRIIAAIFIAYIVFAIWYTGHQDYEESILASSISFSKK